MYCVLKQNLTRKKKNYYPTLLFMIATTDEQFPTAQQIILLQPAVLLKLHD